MHTSSNNAISNLEKQLGFLLYQPYKLLIFLPILIFSTNVIGAMVVVFMAIGLNSLARLLPVLWARINALGSLSRVKVRGRENVNPTQSYVIVANHRSHFDILAVYGWLGIDFRWVMKQELRKVPALGIACEKLGHVFVDRSNPQKAKDSIERAKDEIRDGTSIFFFPEGTRTDRRQMLPFKRGAFKLAKELDLPILPITINGSGKILPTKTLNLIPGTVELVIHEPIASTDLDEQELAQLARDRIATVLKSA
ncbi:MAG: 1-acyl-sn-glycerol-3-phosphate acyltransferase [Pseudomonadales bacterium]|nr:1-acyl-sn-glycerol-3-phosphate acyltransferase [Pseudomonadales bacterium]